MFVFILLGLMYLVSSAPPVAAALQLATRGDRIAFAFGAMFLFTGVLHFLRPAPFVAIVPTYLSKPGMLVALSGAAELVVGVGLLTPALRHWSVYAAIALLIAVFPANLYAATSGVSVPDYPASPFYRWLRVVLQGALIALLVVPLRRC